MIQTEELCSLAEDTEISVKKFIKLLYDVIRTLHCNTSVLDHFWPAFNALSDCVS